MQPYRDAPCDVRELAYADHLVIWALRACAAGRWRCAMIEREFREACGAAGSQARHAVRVFGQALLTHSRRPIVLSRTGQFLQSRDEQLLLSVYAAAQEDDEPRCDAHLAWLLARPACPPFFGAAQITANALLAAGHRLSAIPLVGPARGTQLLAEAV